MTDVPAGVEIIEATGPFFFAVADKIQDVYGEIGERPRVLVLRMQHVPALDATGIHALEALHKHCSDEGTRLVISELPRPLLRKLIRSGTVESFGRRNFAGSLASALDRTR